MSAERHFYRTIPPLVASEDVSLISFSSLRAPRGFPRFGQRTGQLIFFDVSLADPPAAALVNTSPE